MSWLFKFEHYECMETLWIWRVMLFRLFLRTCRVLIHLQSGSVGLLKAVRRRCRQADEEARKSNDQVALPQRVLEGWDDDQCVPVVTLDDLMI
jgi:hypothetical protein